MDKIKKLLIAMSLATLVSFGLVGCKEKGADATGDHPTKEDAAKAADEHPSKDGASEAK